MKLSIIIVNYNTEAYLTKCLESLNIGYHQQIKNKEYEIIVVDNYSDNDPYEMIKSIVPLISYTRNQKNFGFSVANNLAARQAKGELVLFLNPDSIVTPHTLEILLDFMKSTNRIGISTCKVLLESGELDDACHRGFPTPWRAFTYFIGLAKLFPHSKFFNGYHLGYQNMETVHEIDACTGAFLLMRRQLGNELNWFDEDYYWYGEDLDLCFRVKQAGYKIIFFPEVYITHYKGIASGIKKHSSALSRANQKTRYQATKARFEVMRIFYHKHYEQVYPYWLRFLVLSGISLQEMYALRKYENRN